MGERGKKTGKVKEKRNQAQEMSRPPYLRDEEPTWQLAVSQEPSLDMSKARGRSWDGGTNAKSVRNSGETEDGERHLK